MVRDMTHGKPMNLILSFCIPMIFGNLFQQMYNMVDSIIVGKYVGVQALAAVGSTGALNFLILGFVTGLCSGFTIPVSQAFGAGDHKTMRRFITNAAWLSLGIGSVLTLITVLGTRQFLTWMKTPDDIFHDAYLYIVTLFAGILAIFLYNLLSGIMRALGDSRTPLYFLILASIMNIVLDLFFIIVLKTGAVGAAIATVISQLASGVLCFIYIMKKFPILKMERGEWAFSGFHSLKLIGMGIPMGLQFSITAIGSTILQSAVNTLGSSVVAAVTAGGKVSMLFTQPIETLGLTMATYCGQNLGAVKIDRIHKGVRQSLVLGALYAVVAGVAISFVGSYVALLFINSSETAILGYVRQFLIANGAGYVLLSSLLILRNTIQGLGHGVLAMGAGIFEMIARSVVAFALVGQFAFDAVRIANPVAWVAANLLLVPAFFHVSKVLKRDFASAPKEPERVS